MDVQRQVQALLAEVMGAFVEGRPEDARARLSEAFALAPDDPKVLSLADRLFPGLVRELSAAEVPGGIPRGQVPAYQAPGRPEPVWQPRNPWAAEDPWQGAAPDPWAGAPPSTPEGVSATEAPAAPAAPEAAAEDDWEEAEVSYSDPDPEPETPPAPAASDADEPEIEYHPLGKAPAAADGAAVEEVPVDYDWTRSDGPEAFGDALEPDALELLASDEAPPAAAPPDAAGLELDTPDDGRAEEIRSLMEGARELLELADFSGSLELLEKVLELDPDNAEAQGYLARNEDTLVQMYESQIGPTDRVPRVVIQPDEVVWLSMDHRAGFILAQVDGTVSYDDLFALSGMSRLDTCKVLVQLLDEGVIVAD